MMLRQSAFSLTCGLLVVLVGCRSVQIDLSPATPNETPAAAAAPTAPATASVPPTQVASATAKPTATSVPNTPIPTATSAVKATPTPGFSRTLQVGRTNHYRGLDLTVDFVWEAASTSFAQPMSDGGTLLGVRLVVQNPTANELKLCNSDLDSAHVRRADNTDMSKHGLYGDMYQKCQYAPGEASSAYLVFDEQRPGEPLEPLQFIVGQSGETPMVIPFSGPEQQLNSRDFNTNRSSDVVAGLVWTVDGGTIGVSAPGMQANPNQEFIQVRVRLTNTTNDEVRLKAKPTDALRLATDGGTLLQPSEEVNELLTDEVFHTVSPQTEYDGLYVWQVPIGQQNPALVVRSDVAGGDVRIPLGPLPPPAS